MSNATRPDVHHASHTTMATAVSSARTNVPRAILYPTTKALKGPKLADAMHKSLYPHLYAGGATNVVKKFKNNTTTLKRYKQIEVEREKRKVSWFRNKMRACSGSTSPHHIQSTAHCACFGAFCSWAGMQSRNEVMTVVWNGETDGMQQANSPSNPKNHAPSRRPAPTLSPPSPPPSSPSMTPPAPAPASSTA